MKSYKKLKQMTALLVDNEFSNQTIAQTAAELGEMWVAKKTKGDLACPGQRGYDVITKNNRKISVKTILYPPTTISAKWRFNINTYSECDEISLLVYNKKTKEIEEIWFGSPSDFYGMASGAHTEELYVRAAKLGIIPEEKKTKKTKNKWSMKKIVKEVGKCKYWAEVRDQPSLYKACNYWAAWQSTPKDDFGRWLNSSKD